MSTSPIGPGEAAPLVNTAFEQQLSASAELGNLAVPPQIVEFSITATNGNQSDVHDNGYGYRWKGFRTEGQDEIVF